MTIENRIKRRIRDLRRTMEHIRSVEVMALTYARVDELEALLDWIQRNRTREIGRK